MSDSIVYVGVDVAKKNLDFACGDLQFNQVENSSKAHRKIFKAIALKYPQATCFQLVCEASGGYEQSIIDSAMSFGWSVSRVNPSNVRHFAKGIGLLAKTDQIDARLLVEFAQKTNPRILNASDLSIRELRELVSLRKEFVDQITQAKNRMEQQTLPTLRRIYKQTIASYEKQIKKVDEEIKKLKNKDSGLKEKIEILSKVQGVGEQTAARVLAFLPEIGTLTDQQAAAIAGLAPYNNDSGQRKGARFIKGGRSELRTALYMPALTASRINPVLARFYQSLIKRGKKPKVALTAIMRKLVILFNRLIKNPKLKLETAKA